METAYILYDLEATCWRTRRPKRVEIIEVGAVLVNADFELESEFCAFVQPLIHPAISKFCTSLTSIRQSDIDGAILFDDAMVDFEKWMGVGERRVIPMSWGEFDKRQLNVDAKLHNIDLPWLDAHVCFQEHFSKWKGSRDQIGLKNGLKDEGIKWSGTEHRAIDDARNMARLFAQVAPEIPSLQKLARKA
jgi:inhibitor of KinA sporulation pathway (predicted exonuclease)